MIRMKAPGGSGGASHNGEFYQADGKGIVKVPPEAVADLVAHGYELAGPEVEKTAEELEADHLAAEKKAKLKEIGAALGKAKKDLKADPQNTEKAKIVDELTETIKLVKG